MCHAMNNMYANKEERDKCKVVQVEMFGSGAEYRVIGIGYRGKVHWEVEIILMVVKETGSNGGFHKGEDLSEARQFGYHSSLWWIWYQKWKKSRCHFYLFTSFSHFLFSSSNSLFTLKLPGHAQDSLITTFAHNTNTRDRSFKADISVCVQQGCSILC